jgi:hypothetical protein
MIAAGIVHILTTIVDPMVRFGGSDERVMGVVGGVLSGTTYFFFAAVIEFLSRIAKVLEDAARVSPDQ